MRYQVTADRDALRCHYCLHISIDALDTSFSCLVSEQAEELFEAYRSYEVLALLKSDRR